MTEEEYNELVEHYGEKLVDPEVFPETFKYQVKIYLYAKEKKNEQSIRVE